MWLKINVGRDNRQNLVTSIGDKLLNGFGPKVTQILITLGG